MTTLFKKKFMRVPHLSIGSSFREIGRNAHVDWILILALSFLTFAALTLGGMYLYWEISTGNYKNTQAVRPAQEKIFDGKALDAVIGRYDAKSEVSLKAKRGYGDTADPSK